MPIETLSALLGWGALINYAVLLLWFLLFSLGHDFIYNLHGRWFNLRLETFDTLHYGLMGVYKLAILLFNLAPWLVLNYIL
ncbi:MAG: hypothetical protein U5P41_07765 [Gammaproteobacteria bacterium]|nr:hypothetical protein [Gammaproteobacteria bacterium]